MNNQKIVLELTPKEFHALAIAFYQVTAFNIGKALAMLTYPKQGDAVANSIKTLTKQMDVQLMNYIENIYLNDPTSAYNTYNNPQEEKEELVTTFRAVLAARKDLTG